jgi:AbrB family looped-hinge helix DNA binding protein
LTIPAFVRDQLELKKGDRVDVRLEGETITVTPLKQEAK